MEPTNLLAFLKRLHDPESEERRLYRERKAAKLCPFCGTVDPPNTYCDDCWRLSKVVRQQAIDEGVCTSCYSHPIAPAASRRFRGKVTQCYACRDALAARKLDAKLRSTFDI